MSTTIQISDEVWDVLNKLKKKGESFEDVLRKKLKLKKEETKNVKQNKEFVEQVH